jgi:cell wall-associated NlpC family hydrolase
MYKKLTFITLLLLTYTVVHADYTLQASKRGKSKIDNMPKGMLADMKNIPQDPSYYAKQIKSFSKSAQKKKDKHFNKEYFKPWTLTTLDLPRQDFGWEMRFVRKKPIYKVKGSLIDASVYEKWIENANYDELDTKKYKAITTRRTNVRALPTKTAYYRDPKKTGEGFPFDYNQNSALHINVPLHISHFSKDGVWAFVRASYSFGWVKVSDLALVSRQFIKTFKNNNYAMVIKDNMRLYDDQNKAYSLIKLGALFPIADDGKSYLVAKRNEKAHAKIHKVKVMDSTHIAKKPLAFTSKNVAKLAKEFYGEPYGWGGSYGCRDCSATTRDFLGVFGIFLRRNSSKQAKDGTSTKILKGEKSYKKKFINENAQPFRSLLYVPGHIVLYLGQHKGEPVIMHTYWGARKKDGTKHITGRTIITTTEPGKERSDIKERSKLINTLKSIVNF